MRGVNRRQCALSQSRRLAHYLDCHSSEVELFLSGLLAIHEITTKTHGVVRQQRRLNLQHKPPILPPFHDVRPLGQRSLKRHVLALFGGSDLLKI